MRERPPNSSEGGLGREDGTLTYGIGALMKATPQLSGSFHPVRTQQERGYDPGSKPLRQKAGECGDTLAGLPACRTERSVCCFGAPQGVVLLWEPVWTETV